MPTEGEIIEKLKGGSLRCMDLAGLRYAKEDTSRYHSYRVVLRRMVAMRIVTRERRGISVYYSLTKLKGELE